jgi:hypothetical protein
MTEPEHRQFGHVIILRNEQNPATIEFDRLVHVRFKQTFKITKHNFAEFSQLNRRSTLSALQSERASNKNGCLSLRRQPIVMHLRQLQRNNRG